MGTSTISDVLSGNKALTVNVGVDSKSAIILGIVLFTVVVVAGILIKKL